MGAVSCGTTGSCGTSLLQGHTSALGFGLGFAIATSAHRFKPPAMRPGDAIPVEHHTVVWSVDLHPLARIHTGALAADGVCTENLTPWLKLLPCRDRQGLAALLQNRATLFQARYQVRLKNIQTALVGLMARRLNGRRMRAHRCSK